MTNEEIKQFECFLEDSFANDTLSRELRLSDEQKEYLNNYFPKACIEEMAVESCKDGKRWYLVSFSCRT